MLTTSAVSASTHPFASTQTTSRIVTAEIGGTLGAQRAVRRKARPITKFAQDVLQSGSRYAEWLTYI